MKYIVYKDDFDTGEYISMGEYDTEEEAQERLDYKRHPFEEGWICTPDPKFKHPKELY